MSSIDDLKQNQTNEEEVNTVRVDIGGGSTQKKHRVINPKNFNNSTENMQDRIEVDLTQEFPPEKPEEIHESMTKDILEGPNSPFGKYLKEREEEYKERMATWEQEKALDDEENDVDEESSEEAVLGTESMIDFDDSEDDVEEISEENVSIQKEDLSEFVDKLDEENYDVDPEPVDVKEAKPEKIKKEVIENPDIDLDVTNVETKVEEDIIDEEADSTNEVDQDEVLEHLKKLATERLKPVAKSLDLSSFTVLKKPTAKINSIATEQVKAAKWVIPTQDSVVLMKEYLGSELEALREFSEDSSSVSQLYKKYKSIYDHIVSPKPATYEAWLKSTPFSDIDHYFFAVYIASFKGANYIPLDCKEKGCEQTFLTEDVPIMNMVKFESNEAKEKFVRLYESEQSFAGKGIYCSEIVPLSNNIAIGFKDASIYSLFEVASLSQKDKDKYSTILEFIPYIDALYIIHQENQTLEPVGYKIYPDNANKTLKSKISTFFNVLKKLSVDEFTPIRSFVRSITSRSEGIGYIYPSVDCPYCGKPTVEIPTSAEELVFTRYQLGALANTSLK